MPAFLFGEVASKGLPISAEELDGGAVDDVDVGFSVDVARFVDEVVMVPEPYSQQCVNQVINGYLLEGMEAPVVVAAGAGVPKPIWPWSKSNTV